MHVVYTPNKHDQYRQCAKLTGKTIPTSPPSQPSPCVCPSALDGHWRPSLSTPSTSVGPTLAEAPRFRWANNHKRPSLPCHVAANSTLRDRLRTGPDERGGGGGKAVTRFSRFSRQSRSGFVRGEAFPCGHRQVIRPSCTPYSLKSLQSQSGS